jgi:hypothetical protein
LDVERRHQRIVAATKRAVANHDAMRCTMTRVLPLEREFLAPDLEEGELDPSRFDVIGLELVVGSTRAGISLAAGRSDLHRLHLP